MFFMRLASATQSFTAALAVIIALSAPTTGTGQENQPDGDDPLFEKITLSPDGVIATDTTGAAWKYDFALNEFVIWDEVEPEAGEIRYDEEIDILPVEERCTEELLVEKLGSRSITVRADQFVDGNILSSGRITVKGWVRGDVESLGKKVLITRTGQVDGDVIAPRVTIRDGAVVRGKIVERKRTLKFDDFGKSLSIGGLIVVISFTIFFLLLIFLLLSLAPKKSATFYNCFRQYKVRTFSIGLLFLFLFPVLAALVTITIIGVLVLPLLPVIYVISAVMGLASVGNMIGQKFIPREKSREELSLVPSLLGVILFMTIWLAVSLTLGSPDPTTDGFGIFFLVLAILISTFPLLSGFGSAVLTRFGTREYKTWKERQLEVKLTMTPPKPPSVRTETDHIPVPPASTEQPDKKPPEPPRPPGPPFSPS
jgi:uncharacterized membrane protein